MMTIKDYNMFIIFRRLDNADKMSKSVHETALSVHPLGVQTPIDPSGAPSVSDSTILFRGKINIGEIYVPTAFIMHRTMTVWPLSQLVIRPTKRAPFVAITFPGFCTVLMPVSSTFQIFKAE